MEKKKSNRVLIVLLVIFGLIIIGLSGYIVYDKFIANNETEKDNGNNSDNNSNCEVKYNEFTFDNYIINLINRLDNTNDIYAYDVKYYEDRYEIVARYKNEYTVKLATVSKELDPRTFDISNNKIYFVITAEQTDLFELWYIDLNNVDKGPTLLEGFTELYKTESKSCGTYCYIYSTKIYIVNDLIYYTAFDQDMPLEQDSTLKTYNLKTGETKKITDRNVGWRDFFVDKVNEKIFYTNSENLYISNLDGTNEQIITGDLCFNCSALFTESYYKNSPIFSETNGVGPGFISLNLYSFDYSNNTFVELKKDVSYYYVKYNEISYTNNEEDATIYSYFVIE